MSKNCQKSVENSIYSCRDLKCYFLEVLIHSNLPILHVSRASYEIKPYMAMMDTKITDHVYAPDWALQEDHSFVLNTAQK